MTRLIDADAIPWDVEGVGEIPVITKEEIDQLPNIEAPTVGESVGVIRCKDCKFATITDGVYGRNPEVKYCDIWFPSVSEYMPINYYCASAERKEERKEE